MISFLRQSLLVVSRYPLSLPEQKSDSAEIISSSIVSRERPDDQVPVSEMRADVYGVCKESSLLSHPLAWVLAVRAAGLAVSLDREKGHPLRMAVR